MSNDLVIIHASNVSNKAKNFIEGTLRRAGLNIRRLESDPSKQGLGDPDPWHVTSQSEFLEKPIPTTLLASTRLPNATTCPVLYTYTKGMGEALILISPDDLAIRSLLPEGHKILLLRSSPREEHKLIKGPRVNEFLMKALEATQGLICNFINADSETPGNPIIMEIVAHRGNIMVNYHDGNKKSDPEYVNYLDDLNIAYGPPIGVQWRPRSDPRVEP